MALDISGYLKKVSSELFIKYKSAERAKINASIDNIVNRLDEYFGDEVNEITVFGSYSRDTILPRRFDENSDIDILIEFDTEDYKRLKPESYRNKLLKFASDTYRNSLVGKDHPSVVVELSFIKYDLVPCIFDEGILWDSIEIPSKNGGWLETEPEKFNAALTKANTRYNSIVKPIIRLLKYWNACNGYPYASYDLERFVADLDFSGDDYQSGFFYAVDNLSTYEMASWAKKAVNILKMRAEKLNGFLEDEHEAKVNNMLSKIFP